MYQRFGMLGPISHYQPKVEENVWKRGHVSHFGRARRCLGGLLADIYNSAQRISVMSAGLALPCNTSMDTAREVYTNLLFSRGHGHLLWEPEPTAAGEIVTTILTVERYLFSFSFSVTLPRPIVHPV
ncbi:hypothetical protein BD413DRAFT_582452, partial [Trametes elegans]